jgi:hypothetical protein
VLIYNLNAMRYFVVVQRGVILGSAGCTKSVLMSWAGAGDDVTKVLAGLTGLALTCSELVVASRRA